LIFGSPVPGYRAPTDTIDPAARIPLLALGILADAVRDGAAPAAEASGHAPVPRTLHADLKRLRDAVAPALDDRHLARALMAWAQLIGLISFELFGHLNNVVTDYGAHFDYQLRAVGRELGLR
jgi:hypothetical protein